jgi:hypothetical protein
MWRRLKRQIRDPKGVPTDAEETRQRTEEKRIMCTAYILDFVKNNCDDLPVTEGSNTNMEHVKVLPFKDLQAFYGEFECDFRCGFNDFDDVPCCTTFRRAFSAVVEANIAKENRKYGHLFDDLRFMRCKGNFSTCDVCNNAADLLRDRSKRFTKAQRDVIIKYRRLHLKQQAQQRMDLEMRKRKALEHEDINGNPVSALFFLDAITESRGDTPYHKGRSKKDQAAKVIENRTIGLQVYCGPVKEVFLYHTDQFVFKGANIIIEVVRQAVFDLSKRLESYGKQFPRTLNLQFDNANENKNKTMMAFCSDIVERGIVDEIFIDCLVVGHTHASIDQYFSVMSKRINNEKTLFIGSPWSLWKLYETVSIPPTVNRRISVVFDYVSYYKPFLHDKYKFFCLPYCYWFHRVIGKCVMQYKMFAFYDSWLPTLPKAIDFNILADIPFYNMSFVGGEEALLTEMGIPKEDDFSLMALIENNMIQQKLTDYKNLLPELKSLEARCTLKLMEEPSPTIAFHVDTNYQRETIQSQVSKAQAALFSEVEGLMTSISKVCVMCM